jgi:fumarate reductase subunit C
MTTTASRAATTPTKRSTASKVAAAASLAFGFCFFWTVASIDVPHKASDAKMLDWWQQGANLNSALASEFFAIATAVLLLVVVNHLTALAPDRDRWAGFAHSMATVFTSTMLISAALRGVIAHAVKRFEEPLPPVDVLRYSTVLNYTVIGSASMAALALTMVAVSVLVLRTHILANWVAYVGFGCAGIIAVAVGALMGGFMVPLAILWALCMTVAIWRQPTRAS